MGVGVNIRSSGSPSKACNPPQSSCGSLLLRGVLRGICRGLFETSAGLCGVLRWICRIYQGFSKGFFPVYESDPVPVGEKVKSIALGGAVAFLQHAPKKSSADKMKGFPQNSREIAQIVGGQNVGSMQVKRSDPEKD